MQLQPSKWWCWEAGEGHLKLTVRGKLADDVADLGISSRHMVGHWRMAMWFWKEVSLLLIELMRLRHRCFGKSLVTSRVDRIISHTTISADS